MDICTSCGKTEGTWRCVVCIGRPVFCSRCCREAHRQSPFHRVEQWTGTHWSPSWLINVGCEIQLGHGSEKCMNTGIWNQETAAEDEDWIDDDMPPAGELHNITEDSDALHPEPGAPILSPEDAGQVVTVVDTSGVHQLVIRPCRCWDNKDSDDIQLLKMGLFPASFTRVRTVFTLRVLDAYRLDNLVCNTTAYQFYKRLRRLTSPAFPHTVPVSYHNTSGFGFLTSWLQNRYRELMRVGRQW
jgi:hypothetical protein